MTMNRLKQAVGHTKDVANLPPRLLEMYSEFITKNAGAVGQVEGALRSLTYIIPGMLSTRYCLQDILFILTILQAASENPKLLQNRSTPAYNY